MRIALTLLFLFPLGAFAAAAGFPSSSIWLSKTTVIEGDTVTIYTVVFNQNDELLKGSVEFLVGTSTIGAKEVSVPPGNSLLLSETWTATTGAHAISAKFSGAEVSASASEALEVSVEEKPAPPPAPTSSSSRDALSSAIASSSPLVASIASTTITTAENFRATALSALEALASSTAPKGEVLSAEDYQPTPEENAAKSFDIGAAIQNAWTALMGVLLYIFRSSVLFYIFVAFVLFVLLSFVRAILSGPRE